MPDEGGAGRRGAATSRKRPRRVPALRLGRVPETRGSAGSSLLRAKLRPACDLYPPGELARRLARRGTRRSANGAAATLPEKPTGPRRWTTSSVGSVQSAVCVSPGRRLRKSWKSRSQDVRPRPRPRRAEPAAKLRYEPSPAPRVRPVRPPPARRTPCRRAVQRPRVPEGGVGVGDGDRRRTRRRCVEARMPRQEDRGDRRAVPPDPCVD